jgi:hypothetical protein
MVLNNFTAVARLTQKYSTLKYHKGSITHKKQADRNIFRATRAKEGLFDSVMIS